jgi:hypothetical protein
MVFLTSTRMIAREGRRKRLDKCIGSGLENHDHWLRLAQSAVLDSSRPNRTNKVSEKLTPELTSSSAFSARERAVCYHTVRRKRQEHNDAQGHGIQQPACILGRG